MEVRCPRCGRPVLWEETPSRPFCSSRCRLQDLDCWLGEVYRIPAEEDDSDSGDDPHSA